MGLFFNKPKKANTTNINGYIIEENGVLINVPAGLEIYKIPENVKMIGEMALNTMRQTAKEIHFSSPMNLRSMLFFNFAHLTKVCLVEGTKEIGDRAIDFAKVECEIPKSVEQLGTGIYKTTNELIISEPVKKLGVEFASCDTNLEYVEVCGTVEVIPESFINQCKNVRKVVLKEGVKSCYNESFRGLSRLEYMYVPESFISPINFVQDAHPIKSPRGGQCFDPTPEQRQQYENQLLVIEKRINGKTIKVAMKNKDFAKFFINGENVVLNNGEITIPISSMNEEMIYVADKETKKVTPTQVEETLDVETPQVVNEEPMDPHKEMINKIKEIVGKEIFDQVKETDSFGNPVYKDASDYIEELNMINEKLAQVCEQGLIDLQTRSKMNYHLYLEYQEKSKLRENQEFNINRK